MMSLGLYSNVWLGVIIIGTQVVEGKFGVCTCVHFIVVSFHVQ